jgi:hypothetical protein
MAIAAAKPAPDPRWTRVRRDLETQSLGDLSSVCHFTCNPPTFEIETAEAHARKSGTASHPGAP